MGTLIFFLLNLFLIVGVFSYGFTNYLMIPGIILVYIVTVLISLSPFGEWALGVLAGAHEMKRIDMKIQMIPLLECVYNRAIKESPGMVKTIRLKIIYDESPNAYAIGRHTICVTEGCLKLPDQMIMGILAHEIGHIANHHSVVQLLIGGSNIFITAFLFMLKIISYIITGIFGIMAIRSRRLSKGIFVAVIGSISTISVWLWTKFCLLFLMMSMRKNEYVADKYAYKIGFGYELAAVLDSIRCDAPKNGFLKALYESHPNKNDRIAKLQELGTPYYR